MLYKEKCSFCELFNNKHLFPQVCLSIRWYCLKHPHIRQPFQLLTVLMWDLFKNGISFSHKAGKVAKCMCVSKSWNRCLYLRQCVTSYLFSALPCVWWKRQRPVLVCLSSAPECESDPGCSTALLQSQCHRGDHLFYSPKPSGGCWHQHRSAGGVLPPAAQVLSMSAERPPCFSHHQR